MIHPHQSSTTGTGIESITPAQALSHIYQLTTQPQADAPARLFTVQPAAQWLDQARNRPIPRMLFDEFWFEGELCILFAENGVGKSLLAVQIADSISNGRQVPGFKLEATCQPVLYFDFELTDKQFESRYSINYQHHYQFSDTFLRAEINPASTDYEQHGFATFEDFLCHELEQNIIETGVRVLIIDNITYLKTETEKAKDALPLMKMLIQLKRKYKLSILVLAHTPKRDLSQPITRNHLQGSKHLSNLTDSIFTIGESEQCSTTRYLKQIKARSCPVRFDSENVVMCTVHQPHNFVLFELTGHSTEREHLKPAPEKPTAELQQNIARLMQEQPGISAYQIAQTLCPPDVSFASFRVKVARLVNRISNT